MSSQQRQPGVALILAIMFLLIFMGLSMNMVMEARSQAAIQGGVRLSQNYEMAAMNALSREQMGLKDSFVQPSAMLNAHPSEYRFGFLLQSGAEDPDYPDYGVLLNTEQVTMNNGRLELETKVFIQNNSDDYAHSLVGATTTSGSETYTVDKNWDLDGKVTLTAVVTAVGSNVPLSVMSINVAPTNMSTSDRGGNVEQESGEADQTNQGYEGGTVTLDAYK